MIMASLLLLQLCLITLTSISNMLVIHFEEQAKGCPLLNLTRGCNATFINGGNSTLGRFNKIGSVIKAWSSQHDYVYLRCQKDGSYNETNSCLILDIHSSCNVPYSQSIHHLLMISNESTFLVGRVLRFSCKSDIILKGPTSIYCKSNNTWSDSRIPECSGCPYPGNFNNGYYKDSKNLNYTTGGKDVLEVITAYCDENFMLQGDRNRTCFNTGYWSDDVPNCVAVCRSPQVFPTNGWYTFSNGSEPTSWNIPIGVKLMVNCSPGFSSSENDYIKCNEKRQWTYGSGYWCQNISCEKPMEIQNGNYILVNNLGNHSYSGKSVPYGATLYVSCLEGFQNTGNRKFLCDKKGSWSGTNATCTSIVCNISQQVPNGGYKFKNNEISIPATLGYNKQIHVYCNKGYTLKTQAQRTCMKLNEWSGQNPICEEVFCARPMSTSYGNYMDEGGNLLTKDRLNFKYNTNIILKCSLGYQARGGAVTRQCNATGEWSGINPTCSPVTCNKPEEHFCGYFVLNTTNFLPSDIGPISKDASFSEFIYNTTLLFVCNGIRYCQNNTYELRCSEDGSWTGSKPQCESNLQLSDTDNADTNSDAIIGAVCGVISVLLIGVGIFVVFLVLKRRAVLRRNKEYSDSQSLGHSISNEVDLGFDGHEMDTVLETETVQEPTTRMSGNTNQIYINTTVGHSNNEAYYDFRNPESLPKTAIKLEDLQDVVFNGEDANETFENQFKTLPQGMVEDFSEAVKLENKGKNRYTRLYAYDDTRVVLNKEEDSDSDYINACYVHGFNKSRKYIATQGPTKNTLEDFWKMVYQEDTSNIVMLTNLIEEGKNKCVQYWPDEKTKSYGDMKVCLKKVETHSQFDTRTLSVQKGDSAEKMVTQFHFTVWPDKGIPRYASSLVHFLKKVNNAPVYGNGPIIVHCSAGVGRTGTFIALDYLTDQGNTLGYVDVAGCVDALRRQRVSLVQTLDQYIFVHHALVESLMMSSSTILAHKFEERYRELQQIDPKKKKTRICLDFENLQRVSPSSEDSRYVSAKLVANRQKNRDQGVLPVEEFIPFLTNDHGRNVYINAVFLPSYNEKQAFIITQAPLRTTREEFWMLVWEQEVHTIVMMNSIDEIQNDEKYWPERKHISFSNIEISTVCNDKMNDHGVLTLSLKKKDTTRRIKQIQCGGWRKGNTLPDSPDIVLSLMDTVQAWQQQTGNHKILVHCMNGAERSGLFCVISSVIERMKIEQDVAIASVVEEMRNAREQIIPSLEQYQFCYESVLHFIQQYDTYSNFRS